MERLYRALAWLAGIALVAGLIKALLLWTLAINSLAQGFTTNNSDGLWSIFLLMLNTSYGELLITVAHLLIWGAIVATLFVAWADHRRGWLSALIILTPCPPSGRLAFRRGMLRHCQPRRPTL